MTSSLRMKRSAAKALARIATPQRLRLIEAIDRLMTAPTAGSVLKGEFAGLRRLRVGESRVVHEVIEHELVVLAVRVGHRGAVHHP